jgi:hypothetical protein
MHVQLFIRQGDPIKHYGRTGLCRAAGTHGKGQNMLGKAFAVQACTTKIARQPSGRQRRPLSCVVWKSHGKGFAVRIRFAVRWAGFAM